MKILVYIAPFLLISCQLLDVDDEQDNMSFIKGGVFVFGENKGKENEGPEVPLEMPSFYLDKYEVSNRDFAAFIHGTGYLTKAEKNGHSSVYQDRWELIKGVSWNTAILGEDSIPANFDDLPVVHVSWYDANAYCKWKGKRLPTEQELEYALQSPGTVGNIWEGSYPEANTLKDGYFYMAPVGSYTPDSNGVYDLRGNVWEWTEDTYHYNVHDILLVKNPDSSIVWKGAAYDPLHDKPETEQKVIKGGSFLCHQSYCCGYKSSARMAAEPEMTYFHVGFRCACDE